MCASSPLLSRVHVETFVVHTRRERAVKLKSTKTGGGGEEIEAKNEKWRRGRMNGGESRIVVQTFHHPHEGSR